MKAIYANHSYALPESGTVETLESIDQLQLNLLHENQEILLLL